MKYTNHTKHIQNVSKVHQLPANECQT